MMPPDDLLFRLWRALVRVDEDQDTFGDAFLWMHGHPCPSDEWERRFVTRFFFLRKDRWKEGSRYVPLSGVAAFAAAPWAVVEEDAGTPDAPRMEDFINTMKDAIHKETHKERQPKGKGGQRP